MKLLYRHYKLTTERNWHSQGSGPLGSGPIGPGSGYSVMPFHSSTFKAPDQQMRHQCSYQGKSFKLISHWGLLLRFQMSPFSYHSVFEQSSTVSTGYPKITVPRLYGYCEEPVDSIISVFTQLHRSGSEFETLYEQI